MQRLLIDLHVWLGLGLLLVVAVILITVLPAAVSGRQPPTFYLPMHRLVAAALGFQVLFGIVLLVSGRRPQTILHVGYAAVALLVMPAARMMIRRDPAHARIYQVTGTLLLLGVLFRLYSTG